MVARRSCVTCQGPSADVCASSTEIKHYVPLKRLSTSFCPHTLHEPGSEWTWLCGRTAALQSTLGINAFLVRSRLLPGSVWLCGEHEHSAVSTGSGYPSEAKHTLWGPVLHTWLLLPRFRQVCDTSVWAHQHIARVKGALQEELLCFWQMDPTKRGFRKSICWH
jgi:hypothetical protein